MRNAISERLRIVRRMQFRSVLYENSSPGYLLKIIQQIIIFTVKFNHQNTSHSISIQVYNRINKSLLQSFELIRTLTSDHLKLPRDCLLSMSFSSDRQGADGLKFPPIEVIEPMDYWTRSDDSIDHINRNTVRLTSSSSSFARTFFFDYGRCPVLLSLIVYLLRHTMH